MATITHSHRATGTGRPLGILDVLARIVRAAFAGPPILDPLRAEATAVRRWAGSQRRSPGFAAHSHKLINER